MAALTIKPSQVYTIEYRKSPVMLALNLSVCREFTALYWKVGDKDTEMFILRSRYIKKHGLIAAIEAAVSAGKMPKDVLFYVRRLQSTLGA